MQPFPGFIKIGHNLPISSARLDPTCLTELLMVPQLPSHSSAQKIDSFAFRSGLRGFVGGEDGMEKIKKMAGDLRWSRTKLVHEELELRSNHVEVLLLVAHCLWC